MAATAPDLKPISFYDVIMQCSRRHCWLQPLVRSSRYPHENYIQNFDDYHIPVRKFKITAYFDAEYMQYSSANWDVRCIKGGGEDKPPRQLRTYNEAGHVQLSMEFTDTVDVYGDLIGNCVASCTNKHPLLDVPVLGGESITHMHVESFLIRVGRLYFEGWHNCWLRSLVDRSSAIATKQYMEKDGPIIGIKRYNLPSNATFAFGDTSVFDYEMIDTVVITCEDPYRLDLAIRASKNYRTEKNGYL